MAPHVFRHWRGFKMTTLVFAYFKRVLLFGYDVGIDHAACDRRARTAMVP